MGLECHRDVFYVLTNITRKIFVLQILFQNCFRFRRNFVLVVLGLIEFSSDLTVFIASTIQYIVFFTCALTFFFRVCWDPESDLHVFDKASNLNVMVVEMHYHQPSVFRNGYSQAQEMNWNVEFFLTPGMIGSRVLRRTSVQYFLSSDWPFLDQSW